MPELSIVVPVYGVEAYLDTCMESLMAQSYTDFEVILVDDGSPDNCPAMCDAWAEKDPRVQVVHKENGGLSSARNAGMAMARGRYLTFVDPDDTLDPGTYAAAVPRMREGERELVLFGLTVHRENGRTDLWVPPLFETESIGQLAPYMVGHENFPILMQIVVNKIYLRALVEQHQVRFNENRRLYECDEFNYTYLVHVNRMATLQDRFYHYYRREGSLTTTTTQDFYELTMGNAVFVEDFFKAVGGFEDIHDEWLRQRKIRGLRTQLFYLLDSAGLSFSHRKAALAELARQPEKRQLLLGNIPRETLGLRLAHFCLKHRLPGLLAATVSLRNTIKKGPA